MRVPSGQNALRLPVKCDATHVFKTAAVTKSGEHLAAVGEPIPERQAKGTRMSYSGPGHRPEAILKNRVPE